MCGIAGYLGRNGADPGIIERQLGTLVHRGPDSSGYFVDGPAAVGQTRLAVIDLVTGDPPITVGDGRIGVALNGEVYNYQDLRQALIGGGHTFRTTGDTEVIAHLAEGSDPVTVARSLDGMFAFAIWDSAKRQLVLGRDRVGKKPLYYYSGTDVFVFASEIKAILEHPAVTGRLDTSVVPDYLAFGYVPTPATFFEGIRSVPPGHVLVVDESLRPHISQYWSIPVPGVSGVGTLRCSLDEAAMSVRQLLSASVRRRLVSDVPIGAFLSGGIDSSAVVATMAREVTHPIRTFTIGFEDQLGFDERPFARVVAQRFHTDHTEFVVTPDAIELIDEVVWYHDQPFGDSSAIPTYLLSKLTRDHVTVALAGDGGDELFGGYERFAAGMAVDVLHRLSPPLANWMPRMTSIGLVQRIGGDRVTRFAEAARLGLPEALRRWVSYTPDDVLAELGMPTVGTSGRQNYIELWLETEGARTLDRLLNLNMRTYLVDDLLPKVDRMSMARALEVRSPFLDQHLIEHVVRLAPATKIRGTSLKRCLKRAFADELPGEILSRSKRGFGVPLDRWFREDLAGYVTSTLGTPTARIREMVNPEGLDAVLECHRAGQRNLGHALWTLLTLELFLRRYS